MTKRKLNTILKKTVPPIVIDILRDSRVFGQISFKGNYSSWKEATEKSQGYADDNILEKVRKSALQVKQGIAAYERDSVVFAKPDYRWPMLSALLFVANSNKGLYVLDFGGSLGSLYFQHKNWFEGIGDFYWGVLEQPHFVDVGRREFTTKELGFFLNIKEYIEQKKIPNVVVFSGVLQYLETPFQVLKEITENGSDFLLIDRIALIAEGTDRITIQHIPASIYKASYPAWFFVEKQFIAGVQSMGYKLLNEFSCDDHVNNWSYFKGFLFKKNEKEA